MLNVAGLSPGNASNDGEISLLEIVNFLRDTWKKLAIAGILGAALGLGIWWLFTPYSAEYILINNTSTNNTNNTTYALDIVSWKTLQKSLPNLAAQAEAEGKVPDGQGAIYRAFSDERWWQKNVVPGYALSKADTKDLAVISKDLDAASMVILSLTVTGSGTTKAKALETVLASAKLLRTGGAFLQLRNILNGYERETISSVADIRKKITTTEIELGYQNEHARALEDLYKRYPASGTVAQQPVDIKQSGAKYLSITSQIVAINGDIIQSKENLQRLQDRLGQIAIIKNFLEEATPLLKNSLDGLALCSELLKIEDRLRSKLAMENIKSKEILDQLRAQLLEIQVRFTIGLDANMAPMIRGRIYMVKLMVSGLLAGFFLMLLILLSQKFWHNIKIVQKSAGAR